MAKRIVHDHNYAGIERRGLSRVPGLGRNGAPLDRHRGVLTSQVFGRNIKAGSGERTSCKISDSHISFNKPVNPDAVVTLQAALNIINGLPSPASQLGG